MLPRALTAGTTGAGPGPKLLGRTSEGSNVSLERITHFISSYLLCPLSLSDEFKWLEYMTAFPCLVGKSLFERDSDVSSKVTTCLDNPTNLN